MKKLLPHALLNIQYTMCIFNFSSKNAHMHEFIVLYTPTPLRNLQYTHLLVIVTV